MLFYNFEYYFIYLVLVFQKTVDSNSYFTLQINSILHDGFTGHN